MTFHAEDVRVAQAACIFAGDGAFGLKDENGESHSLFMAFMGEQEVADALAATFGSFSEYIDQHREEIAAALETVMPLDVPARRTFDCAMGMIQGEEERRRFRLDTEEGNRTSLAKIAPRCWDIARQLRGLCADCAKAQAEEVKP